MLLYKLQGFPVAQWLKNPPTNAGDTGDASQYLGQEDPIEEGMATSSGILAWRIRWIEEPGVLQSMVLQKVGHDQSG